jgi:hypothetical protein
MASIGVFSTLLAFATPASAQEFSVLSGPLVSDSQNSYSWEANYREGLGRYAAWSFSWINEGHIPNHHRGGNATQVWGRLPLWNDRLELSAGAGPYRYFDTTAARAGGSYSNTRDWGALWSVRAAYYFDRRWTDIPTLRHQCSRASSKRHGPTRSHASASALEKKWKSPRYARIAVLEITKHW